MHVVGSETAYGYSRESGYLPAWDREFSVPMACSENVMQYRRAAAAAFQDTETRTRQAGLQSEA